MVLLSRSIGGGLVGKMRLGGCLRSLCIILGEVVAIQQNRINNFF